MNHIVLLDDSEDEEENQIVKGDGENLLEEFESNCDNDENIEVDEDGVSQITVDCDTSFPTAMLFFMLYGPYSAKDNDFDITKYNFVFPKTLSKWKNSIKRKSASIVKVKIRSYEDIMM